MSDIGVFKEFDKLGRIVIPKELRDRFLLNGKVELIATKDGVLIRNPDYMLIPYKKVSEENTEKTIQ